MWLRVQRAAVLQGAARRPPRHQRRAADPHVARAQVQRRHDRAPPETHRAGEGPGRTPRHDRPHRGAACHRHSVRVCGAKRDAHPTPLRNRHTGTFITNQWTSWCRRHKDCIYEFEWSVQ